MYVDMDSFFASVEARENEILKGEPIIVGNLPYSARAVVSAASYEARKFGVHSAMSIRKAYSLCPSAIFLRPNLSLYRRVSSSLHEIFTRFSDEVEMKSIDEAAIKVNVSSFEDAEKLAKKIKECIRLEHFLTCSLGIARTRLLAKMASSYKKPDGLFMIKKEEEHDFLMNLPLEKIWGVGKATLGLLKKRGISNTKELFKMSETSLCAAFGYARGKFLYSAVRGEDSLPLTKSGKSVSVEKTYPVDLLTTREIQKELLRLSFSVSARLHASGLSCRSLCLKLRSSSFETSTFTSSLRDATHSAKALYRAAASLFSSIPAVKNVRLLGIKVSSLLPADSEQKSLLPSYCKEEKFEEAICALRDKFPSLKIVPALFLEKT